MRSALPARQLASARPDLPQTGPTRAYPARSGLFVPLALSLTCIATAVSLGYSTVAAADTSRSDPRIVGGKPASTGAYPFMAALVSPGLANADAQFCGASLIRPDWVVTAAHCVEGQTAEQVEVLLGATDLDTEQGRRFAVSKVVVHPDYTNAQTPDIALLQLSNSAGEAPLALLGPNDAASEKPGTTARTMGWGTTDPYSEGSSYSAKLLEVDVPIVSQQACERAALASGGTIDEATMICAGPPKGGRDSCYGDSGGPLVVPGRQPGTWLLAGIVSFGTGECAEPGLPGVYTRVSGLNRWIEAAIGGSPEAVVPGQPTSPTEPEPVPPGVVTDPAPDSDDVSDEETDEETDEDIDPCDDPELSLRWDDFVDGFCEDPAPTDVVDDDEMPADPTDPADLGDGTSPGVVDGPSETPAGSYGETYTGELTADDPVAFLSEEGFSIVAGTLQAELTTRDGSPLALELERYDEKADEWTVVASADAAKGEPGTLSFEAPAGIYSWVVYSTGETDSGSYSLVARLTNASGTTASTR